MRDDARWDGEGEGDRIAALQRTLSPLREQPRPWGEVIARARISALPRPRSRVWPVAIATALAAAVAIGWVWGRRSHPVLLETTVQVAAPLPEPAPQRVVEVPVPMPVPAVVEVPLPTREPAVASSKPRTRKRTIDPPPRVEVEAPKEDLDVDCILDPAMPKCRRVVAPLDGDLPHALTTADIKRGMSMVKEAARRCGVEHGASAGEQVRIKFAIAGATGSVIESFAVSDHGGTRLGECVAAAVRSAQFPRFLKSRLGVIYPFSM
jgi:hypothetical protein